MGVFPGKPSPIIDSPSSVLLLRFRGAGETFTCSLSACSFLSMEGGRCVFV